MKDKSCFPSRRASALLISSMCIAFVCFVAYTENTFEYSYTQIRKDPGTEGVNIDHTKQGRSYDTRNNIEDHTVNDVPGIDPSTKQGILINIVPYSIANTKQSSVINNLQHSIPIIKQGSFNTDVQRSILNTQQSNVINNVPGKFPNTKQGIFNNNVRDKFPNTKQGIFNNNVRDKFPNTKQGIFNNNVPDKFPNTKQGILINNVPDNIVNTKQGVFNNNVPDKFPNTKQGVFNNNVPDKFPNTKQGVFNNNVPDKFPNTKQGVFNNNVPDKFPNTKQGILINNVPDNIVNTKQSLPDNIVNTKQSIPDSIVNTKQSIPDSIVNTKQSIPDSIRLTKQHTVINIDVPYIAAEKVHTASSDHQFGGGLPQYTETLMRKPYTLQDHINLGNVAVIQTAEHVKVNKDNVINGDGMGNTGDVKQDSMPGTKLPHGNTHHSPRKRYRSSVAAVRQNNLVLLLTYLRSGSTLTADIIQQVPGVFYAYEPLRRYIATDNGYISMNGICSMNNLTCRQPTLTSELPQLYIEDIVRYYGCDLEHVVGPFLWSETSMSVKRYKDCTHVTTQLNADNQFCLHQCFESTRYLKTIRLSMDIVEILMKIIPRLKVIHLLRDPRGMIESRKRGGFLGPRMDVDITTVARSVCERFERDIEIATKLKQKYPGRLKTYLYEQIAEHPKSASASLFNFLGLTASDSFDMWLHNHTAAGSNGKYYGTTRANSSLTASSWRLHMSYNDVLKVDNECQTFYSYTGILKAVSNKSLRDLNFHLRLPSPEF
ncbi:uncharacterized protein LOC110464150 isoform X2 [Mizuhopecten yessoensis]|uniref:uncharacterized protein LOC110464150 isoform X2 n=1 Tax=Mizuhopecten yessoensis TaxID=6573 RepID=UPI000B45B5CB|nr:uncharacterized protein LOC110464150 isoform X2 [Mizuhopecten yessoensis]